MIHLPFADRAEAGGILADELTQRKITGNVSVLALPRGGVPVAFEVAKRLKAELDVVIVRKLGVPWQPELAIGAIASGSFLTLDQDLIRALDISRQEIDAVVNKEKVEIGRREKLYRQGRPALGLRGRTVLLVDDGLATGSTMLVAARYVHSLGPARTVIAVPVGSVQACERLQTEADDCICLATPEPFEAVGERYVDFRQVSDFEVQRLLEQNRLQQPRAAYPKLQKQ